MAGPGPVLWSVLVPVLVTGGAAAIGGLVLLVWLAQRLGRARAERDAHDGAEEALRVAGRIDDAVARLSGPELTRRLRAWRRR